MEKENDRMEPTPAIEKLSMLENRIAQTAERFAQLKEQYRALQDQKDALERELDRLKGANRDLNEKVSHLKVNQEKILSSFQKDDVRKRIDRVLEKLGELQL
jgi:cell division protein FtsB